MTRLLSMTFAVALAAAAFHAGGALADPTMAHWALFSFAVSASGARRP